MTNFKTVFEDALGLPKPWHVQKVENDKDKLLLRVYVSFERGSRFVVEGQDKPLPVYDTQEKVYRHSNCFTHECELVVRVPRVKLPDGKVKTVRPPCAGKVNGFTHHFEALAMLLLMDAPVAPVARKLGVSDYVLHQVARRHVQLAQAQQDLSGVTEIGIDETSSRRGHNYVTLIADLSGKRVVDVQPGRGSDTLEAFGRTLLQRGGQREQIKCICMDMSPAFISGADKCFPLCADLL